MDSQEKIKGIQKKIKEIRKSVSEIKDFRPGTVTEQYKNPKVKTGGYHQLNYTFEMKTKTEYVRKSMVPLIKEENSENKKFRALIDR